MDREYRELPRRAAVRGIFPVSRLARQLRLLLPQAGEVARTFAEIEAALGRRAAGRGIAVVN
jgi:hypothetical protein